MSLASRQSISLLAVVHGCFKTMDTFNLSGDLAPTVLYGIDVSEKVIHNFPETGNRKSNLKWMTEKIHQIDDDLNKSKSVYTMIVLMSLALQIIIDLSEKIKDKAKLKQLSEIEEVIFAIRDAIDPKWDHDEAYKEADRILDKLYGLLGFVRL